MDYYNNHLCVRNAKEMFDFFVLQTFSMRWNTSSVKIVVPLLAKGGW